MPYQIADAKYGTFQWLLREIAGRLWGNYDPNTLNHQQESKVESYIQSGVMRFYFPPPLAMVGKDGSQKPAVPHQWSFLRPTATLTLKASVSTYLLPEDFSGVLGEFCGATTRIPVAPDSHVRQLVATRPQSGSPTCAGVHPKSSDGTGAQRYEVVFYPTPDADTEVTYTYSVSPLELSESRMYPLGGSAHAETILASCLAFAASQEDVKDPAADARFMDRLAASIQLDVQSLKAQEEDTWPVENPASGLDVNRAYLRRLVGLQLGYGANAATWTKKQMEMVSVGLETGLRNFYVPAILPGERYAHEWSFLCPAMSLTLSSAVYEYDLPSDFAMLDGPISYAPSASTIHPSIRVVSEFQVYNRLQRTEAARRPEIAAVVLKPASPGAGTEYKLVFWPVPDETYEVRLKYKINPGNVQSETDVPLGGRAHYQTILESCLAAAEEMSGEKGPHGKRFMDRLAASVSYDRQTNSPDTLGYGVDQRGGDRTWRHGDWHDCDENLVTYNGASY